MQSAGRPPFNARGFGVLGVLGLIVTVIVLVVVFSLVRRGSNGTLQLSNGCKDTNLALVTVHVQTMDDPLNLQAKLTMGSQPVANERVSFRSVGRDSKGHQLQTLIGQATTNTSGMATYQSTKGLADQSITYGVGGVVTGFMAEFDGNNATDNVKNPSTPFYCGSKSTTPLPQPVTVQKIEI